MTGRWSGEESRGDMETMEQTIRSPLFCFYIWLPTSSSLTLVLTVETSSVKAYVLLKSVACTLVCLCKCACMPPQYFCSCHGNIRCLPYEGVSVGFMYNEPRSFVLLGLTFPLTRADKQFECAVRGSLLCRIEFYSVLLFVSAFLSLQQGLASFDSPA